MRIIQQPSLLILLITLASLKLASARSLRSIGSSSPQEHFTAEQQDELAYCFDAPSSSFSVPDDNERHDCKWLMNIPEKGYLCDRHEVSSVCRQTCGVCEDTLRAVELLSTCANEEGDVQLPGMGIWINCDSLNDNPETQPEACAATPVALHCPVVCDTFQLGPCSAMDPMPNN
jgi:hypothetical protein